MKKSMLGGVLIRLLFLATSGLWAAAEATRLATGDEPRIGLIAASSVLFLLAALWLWRSLARPG